MRMRRERERDAARVPERILGQERMAEEERAVEP